MVDVRVCVHRRLSEHAALGAGRRRTNHLEPARAVRADLGFGHIIEARDAIEGLHVGRVVRLRRGRHRPLEAIADRREVDALELTPDRARALRRRRRGEDVLLAGGAEARGERGPRGRVVCCRRHQRADHAARPPRAQEGAEGRRRRGGRSGTVGDFRARF